MLIVQSNKAQYEYDIHSLVKAFYPEQEVKVLTPESVIKDRKIKELPADIMLEFSDDVVTLKFIQQSAVDNVKELNGERHTYTRQITEEDISDYKNVFKRFLYTSLREETDISLPWGNLTGIRPTKIAMTMMEQDKSEEEIAAFLQDKHLVSREKTELGIDIARREKTLLDQLHYEDGYSLYIGIPFCPTTCLYCSFTSFPIITWKDRVADYLDALEKEIAYTAEAYREIGRAHV